MEDSGEGHPQAEQADGQRPLAEGLISDNSPAPSQQKQTSSNFKKTKQFAWRFIGRPIKWLADTLDPYNGLLTALATVALAFLTYFLAVYANDLGRISGRQLTVLQGQLDEMHAGRRPFVNLTNWEFQNSIDYGQTDVTMWQFIPMLGNTGDSTAMDAFHFTNWKEFPGLRVSNEFQFPDISSRVPKLWQGRPDTNGSIRFPLGPHVTLQGMKATIPVDALTRAWKGESVILVWGWVEYSDDAKPPVRHRTEYGARVVVFGDPAVKTTKFFMEWLPIHNCTDTGCYHNQRPYPPAPPLFQ